MPVVPPTVRLSKEAVPLDVIVIPMVVELLTVTVIPVMSRLAIHVASGVTTVLNSKPAGARKTSVPELPISPLAPSTIVICPSVVHGSGDDAFAALSAEMFRPPEAGVSVTLPKAVDAATKANASAKPASKERRRRNKSEFSIGIDPGQKIIFE